jgi:hypothetical protein
MIPVLVGANGTKTFSPDTVFAPIGSMIQFQFVGGNHTATMSNFANPCTPINQHNASAQGFHSGFQPISASTGMKPTFSIPITSNAPIWVYCAQAAHCAGGMSMVINVK